ncbi:MAG TPA: hypothetical protein VGD27_10725, partial [Longimicrobiales bacterium]
LPTEDDRALYETVNHSEAEAFIRLVKPTDLLVVHDPQPLALGALVKNSSVCAAFGAATSAWMKKRQARALPGHSCGLTPSNMMPRSFRWLITSLLTCATDPW